MIQASLLTSAHAERDENGLLNVTALGWASVQAPTPPMTLIVQLTVEWAGIERAFGFQVDLLDEDGHDVPVVDVDGNEADSFSAEASVTVAPDLDARHGDPHEIWTCIQIPSGLITTPGRYRWQLSADGDVIATRAFAVL